VRGVAPPPLRRLAAPLQELRRVLSDRLQHADARLLAGPLPLRPPEQTLLDEGGQPGQHPCARRAAGAVVAHGHGRLGGAAADEDGEPPEERALGGREQVVAPGEGVAQGALARRQVVRPARQQRQPPFQPGQQGARGEQGQPGGRQLQRQGQAIQPATERRHVRRVAGVQGEVGAHCLGALHEEGHRRRARHRGGVGAILRGRQGQRRHRELALAAHAQRGPAGHQRRHAGARPQQRAARRPRGDNLLEVVQQQEALPAAQGRPQALLDGLPDDLAQAERPRHRGQHQRGVAQVGEAHRDHPVGEGVPDDGGDLLGQARLADPARPHEREQAHVPAPEQARHLFLLARAPNQRCQGRWQGGQGGRPGGGASGRRRGGQLRRGLVLGCGACGVQRIPLRRVQVEGVSQRVERVPVGPRAPPLDVGDRGHAQPNVGPRGQLLLRQAPASPVAPQQRAQGARVPLPGPRLRLHRPPPLPCHPYHHHSTPSRPRDSP